MDTKTLAVMNGAKRVPMIVPNSVDEASTSFHTVLLGSARGKVLTKVYKNNGTKNSALLRDPKFATMYASKKPMSK